MLVELSVVEQRYYAVMEVISGGIPVVEVAGDAGPELPGEATGDPRDGGSNLGDSEVAWVPHGPGITDQLEHSESPFSAAAFRHLTAELLGAS
jgi:hypothetical protein